MWTSSRRIELLEEFDAPLLRNACLIRDLLVSDDEARERLSILEEREGFERRARGA